MVKSELIKSPLFVQGIALVLLIFIIPLQLALQHPLISASSDFLLSFQHIRIDSLVTIFSSVKYINEVCLYSAVIPFVLHFFEPVRAPKMILSFCLTFYLSNLLALIFQEFRPFWYTKKIRPEICMHGYGNPSTELMLATTVIFTLSIEVFHRSKFRGIVYSSAAFLACLVGFSPIYLGENYPHQVLTSLFLSFILITFAFTFDKYLLEASNKSCYNYQKNRIYIVYWFLAIILMIFVVVTIDALILSFSPESPKRINYAVKHCSDDYNPDGRKNVHSCACVFYIIGYVAGSLKLSARQTIFWTVTNFWKRIIRFVLNGAICWWILAGFDMIPTQDTLTRIIFHNVVPYVICAALTAFYLPIAFKKMKLTLDVAVNMSKSDLKILFSRKRLAINT